MRKLSLFFLAFYVLLSACTKTGPQGPAGPAGQSGQLSNGTMDGIVTLYDQYGDKQPHSVCTGVRVILYNASNAVVDSINADTSGKYSFNNIAPGDYSEAFRDTGYGQMIRIPFQFTGGGTIAANVDISQIPKFTFSITGDSIHKVLNDTQVVIYGTITPTSRQRNIAIFIANSPSVSSTPGSYVGEFGFAIVAGASTFSFALPVNTIYMTGMPSGSTAYCMLYSAAYFYGSQSEYTDLNTGQTQYNALGYSMAAPAPLKL